MKHSRLLGHPILAHFLLLVRVLGWLGGVSGNSSCSPGLAGDFFSGLAFVLGVPLVGLAFGGPALGSALAVTPFWGAAFVVFAGVLALAGALAGASFLGAVFCAPAAALDLLAALAGVTAFRTDPLGLPATLALAGAFAGAVFLGAGFLASAAALGLPATFAVVSAFCPDRSVLPAAAVLTGAFGAATFLGSALAVFAVAAAFVGAFVVLSPFDVAAGLEVSTLAFVTAKGDSHGTHNPVIVLGVFSASISLPLATRP
jgi:hypothetical protein